MCLRKRRDVGLLTLFAATATLVVGISLSVWSERGELPATKAKSRSSAWVSASDRSGAGLKLKAETERQLGVFDLGKGRRIRISAADTVDGSACLIEEDDDGAGSSCLDGGFFALRKVEFLVSSQGGPEQFTALHVAGVAAPSIRAASLVKTDGTAVQLELNSERAFVYESPSSELEARIYPTALRLYGSNRKLTETVTFPPAS
jgi:hypothetical protein